MAVDREWLQSGKALYAEVADNKPPGVFPVNGLKVGVFGPNIVDAAELWAPMRRTGLAASRSALSEEVDRCRDQCAWRLPLALAKPSCTVTNNILPSPGQRDPPPFED